MGGGGGGVTEIHGAPHERHVVAHAVWISCFFLNDHDAEQQGCVPRNMLARRFEKVSHWWRELDEKDPRHLVVCVDLR